MSKEIVVVTAFFDIKRDSFEIYQRSEDQYIEYFRFWARIKNKLIVFCQQKNYKKIYDIRKDYGLADRTRIVVVDDVFQIEPVLYEKMCLIAGNQDFLDSRYFDPAISNRADYDYVTSMKYYFISEAAGLVNEDVNIAWIDFGFNHGGKYYTNPSDFEFLWEYEFEDLIYIFCLQNPDTFPGLDSLMFQKDCVMSGVIIVPQNKARELWKLIRQSMQALVSLDCIDDDQQLVLMAYKLRKEMFNVIITDWFEGIMVCSTQTFSTVKNSKPEIEKHPEETNVEQEKEKKPSLLRRGYWKLKSSVRRSNKSQEEESPRRLTKSQEFADRMYKKAVKYYGA